MTDGALGLDEASEIFFQPFERIMSHDVEAGQEYRDNFGGFQEAAMNVLKDPERCSQSIPSMAKSCALPVIFPLPFLFC